MKKIKRLEIFRWLAFITAIFCLLVALLHLLVGQLFFAGILTVCFFVDILVFISVSKRLRGKAKYE